MDLITLTYLELEDLTFNQLNVLPIFPQSADAVFARSVFVPGVLAAQVAYATEIIMYSPIVQRGQVVAGSSVTLLSRIADATGNLLQPVEVDGAEYGTGIFVTVYDRQTGLLRADLDIDPDTALSSSLQLGANWTQDSVGYNCSITIPGEAFPTGDTTYRVQITIQPLVTDEFTILWDLQCETVY